MKSNRWSYVLWSINDTQCTTILHVHLKTTLKWGNMTQTINNAGLVLVLMAYTKQRLFSNKKKNDLVILYSLHKINEFTRTTLECIFTNPKCKPPTTRGTNVGLSGFIDLKIWWLNLSGITHPSLSGITHPHVFTHWMFTL